MNASQLRKSRSLQLGRNKQKPRKLSQRLNKLSEVIALPTNCGGLEQHVEAHIFSGPLLQSRNNSSELIGC